MKKLLILGMLFLLTIFSSYSLDYDTDTQFATFIDWTNTTTATQDMVGDLDLVTNVGSTTIDTTNFYIDFDGTNDRLEFPAVNFTTPYSYSFLVNVDVVAADKNFMNKYVDGNNRLLTFMSNTDWDLRTITTVSGSSTDSTTTSGLSGSTWYLVTIVDDGSTIKQYVDTTEVTSGTSRGSHVNNAQLMFGSNSVLGGRYLNGKESQFYLFNKALNTTEITTHYNNVYTNRSFNPFAASTPKIQTNLSGTYNINELNGTATTSSNVNMTFYLNGVQIGQENNTNSSSYNVTLLEGVNNISLKSENADGTNWNNFTLTYQPYQYFYFQDSVGSPITNFTLNGTDFTDYASINASDLGYGNISIVFEKLGYVTSTITFSLDITSQLNNTYTANNARILLYIRDQSTGDLITGTNFSVEFIATVGALTSTTTGLVNITNSLFENEVYLAVISNTNYQTETLNFNFNNQEELILNAYMIESNNSNLGVVFVEPVSSFGQSLVGATVKALQWDTSTSSYVQVSQATTGSDGLGALNIILNDKVYIFTATYEGVSANSTQEIIDTTENGKTITIVISGTSAENNYLFSEVTASVTESFNTTTNISTLTLTWNDLNGISQTVCLNSYRLIRTSENLLTESCTSGTSGIYILNFDINSSYTTLLKGEFKVNGAYYTIDSFRYDASDSAPKILENLGLNLIIVPLMFLSAIAIGMIMQNVYIGTLLLVVFGGFSLYLAPTILTKGIVAFLGFVAFMAINYGVKPR